MGQLPSLAAGGLPAPAPLSPQPSLLPCLPTARKRHGAGSQKGPQGLPNAPLPPAKKKKGSVGEETILDYSRLCISDSVFLSGGAGFLSKVSLCALTDTQELSQPRSSLALLRNRSGPGGGREGRAQEPSGGRGRLRQSIFQLEKKNFLWPIHSINSGGEDEGGGSYSGI